VFVARHSFSILHKTGAFDFIIKIISAAFNFVTSPTFTSFPAGSLRSGPRSLSSAWIISVVVSVANSSVVT
jgi:hypothetical protein